MEPEDSFVEESAQDSFVEEVPEKKKDSSKGSSPVSKTGGVTRVEPLSPSLFSESKFAQGPLAPKNDIQTFTGQLPKVNTREKNALEVSVDKLHDEVYQPVARKGNENRALKQRVQKVQLDTEKRINELGPQVQELNEVYIQPLQEQIDSLSTILNDETISAQQRNAAAQEHNRLLEENADLLASYQTLNDELVKNVESFNKTVNAQKKLSSAMAMQERMRQQDIEKEYSIFDEGMQKLGAATGQSAIGILNLLNNIYSVNPYDHGSTKLIRENLQNASDAIDKLDTQEIPENFKHVFKGDFSGKKLAYIVTNALAQTAPTVAAGLVTGGTGAAISGAGLGYQESYDTLKGTGLTEDQAAWASTGLAIPLGLLEKWGISDAVAALGGKTAVKSFAKELLTEEGKKLTQEQLFEAGKKFTLDRLKTFLTATTKTALKEPLTEMEQAILSEGAKQAAEAYTGQDSNKNQSLQEYLRQTGEDIAEQGVYGLFGGAGFGALGGYAQARGITSTGYEKAMELKDPAKFEQFQAELLSEVEQGVIKPQQAEQAIQNVQLIHEADAKIPGNITPEKREQVTNYLIEKGVLEKEIEGKDESLILREKERIDELDRAMTKIASPELLEPEPESKKTTSSRSRESDKEVVKNEQGNQKGGRQEETEVLTPPAEDTGGTENVSPVVETPVAQGQQIDLKGDPKQIWMQPMDSFIESELPNTQGTDEVPARRILTDRYEGEIGAALAENKFQQAIADERMTANDAKTIIEAAGLEVPADILTLATNEKRTETTTNPPETPTGNESVSGNGEQLSVQTDSNLSGTTLTDGEKANLQSIEAATGDNFRLIQNTYNKYGEGKPLTEITAEDYQRAVEKRAAEKSKKEPEKEKRRFTQQILADESIPENVKQAFAEDTVNYERLPNSVTISTADKLLNYLGLDEGRRAVMDLGNGMGSATRFTMAQQILTQLNREGEYDSMSDFLEEFVQLTTDYGQGIQALSLYSQFSPAANLRKAQREVKRQRDKKFKQTKKTTDKIISETTKINKESAKEAVKKVRAKVEKAAEIPDKPSVKDKSYGSKNKLVTKDRYQQLKKQLKGKLFSSPVPPELIEIGVYHLEAGGRKFSEFAANMIGDFGRKVSPYLRDVYNKAKKKFDDEGFSDEAEIEQYYSAERGKEMLARIERKLKSGDIAQAIAEINQLPNRNSIWGKYRKFAAGRLKGLLRTEIESDIEGNPALKEFTDGLVKNIRGQIEQPDTTKKTEPKAAIEIIADAYRNLEKYNEVWEQTQAEIQEKYKDDPEKLAELDAYFGDILIKPFSDKLVQESIKKGLKDLDLAIEDIVVQHYSVYDRAKVSLTDKLIEQAGLEGREAKELADAIAREFDKIATERKQHMLNRIFSVKQKKKPQIKTLEQQIIELSNLGAFDNKEILDKWAEAMGFPELTETDIKKITDLSDKVQQAPEGFQKFRAIEDLLTYQANIKGISKWDIPMSLWYASVLSGPNTQLKNFVANAANSMLLYTNAVAQNPKSAGFVARGFVAGLSKGIFEASETLRTGYSPIRGKVEVPPALERKNFEGLLTPLNAAKYVRRIMVAADVLFFEGLREMRAYQLAYKEAAAKGKLEPGIKTIDEALKILNVDNVAVAEEQAHVEYVNKLAEIDASEETDQEKRQQRKQADKDRKRRVQEIIEQGRSEDFTKETASFASKGTYNYPPDGVLGAAAKLLNQFGEKVPPVKFIVPFTNIIANVANETLNYTPLGFVAAARKGGIGVSPKVELTEQERVDQMVKAVIGTTLMTVLFLLTQKWDEDDEPFMEITANGTGDYRKNYELQEKGWQPYSIRIGNKWYSYQLSPLQIAFALIGNVRDVEKYRETKLTDKGLLTQFGVAAGATSRAFLDQTFLSSANSFLSAAMDPRNEDRASDLARSLEKTAAGFVVPALYTQAAREVENWMDIPSKEVRGTWMGVILKDIPVARNGYEDKLNALGEPVVPRTNILLSSVEPDKIWNLIADKKAWIGVPSRNTVTVVDPETEQERILTDKEYYDFVKNRGGYIKNYLEENYDELAAMSPEEARTEIKNVKRDATKYAKGVVLGEEDPGDF